MNDDDKTVYFRKVDPAEDVAAALLIFSVGAIVGIVLGWMI